MKVNTGVNKNKNTVFACMDSYIYGKAAAKPSYISDGDTYTDEVASWYWVNWDSPLELVLLQQTYMIIRLR